MEVAPHARRRKACDLCTTKRIKCDGLKPSCSNCVLYGVECKLTPKSKAPPARDGPRNATPIRKTPAGDSSDSGKGNRMRAIEARLERMEAMMLRTTSAVGSGSSGHGSSTTEDGSSLDDANRPPSSVQTNATPMEAWAAHGPAETVSPEASHASTSLLSAGAQHRPRRELPPPEEVKPVIERYFREYNSIVPLFERPAFMQMVDEWHSQRPLVEWAAINVVLAITYRIVDRVSIDDRRVAKCIENAQSAMIEVFLRTEDLLGLQVVLGLVLLLLGTPRNGPLRAIPMLMASGTRLGQLLRLQTHSRPGAMSPAEAQHRSRVFWILYILDKDTSLRFQTPSAFLDADIEHGLPEITPEDGAATLSSTSGTATMNFLHTWVHLAYVQGRIYDLLCTTQARRATAEEKRKRLSRVQGMLSRWRRSIPPEFDLDLLVGGQTGMQAQQILAMCYTHLMCHFIIYDINENHDFLVERIRTVTGGRVSVEDDDGDDPYHPITLATFTGWDMCVSLSRACLKASYATGDTDYFIWYNSCSHLAAGLVLLTNIVDSREDANIEADEKLVDRRLDMYDRLLAAGGPTDESLRSKFNGLKDQARLVVHRLISQKVTMSLRDIEHQASQTYMWPADLSNPVISQEEPSTGSAFYTAFEEALDPTLSEPFGDYSWYTSSFQTYGI
ncbi:hypothetical protein GQ53DRAFT_837647 [Thozetella sp. PMI_491]|nr:hypothetical protein GQ53DRAFT_837647 [Thozetella sp. PMI_491]